MPPAVSFVIATHNRRDVLASTLDRVAECGLSRLDFQIIVVDNNSSEDVAKVVNGRSYASLVALRGNRGACAKAFGVEQAHGRLVVFLDDDSYPHPGCVERMIELFDRDASLGAAGYTVHLPDGSQECSALPHVFVGCGVGLRGAALREVGGVDRSFFMQAEEYDLSFRLLAAGWKVEIFGDLQVEHGKTPTARRPQRTSYFDIRNNLRIAARYLPPAYRRIYQRDWLERYGWLAERDGHLDAHRRGSRVGWRKALAELRARRFERLSPAVLEAVFCWEYVGGRMRELRYGGAQRIALLDVGKNIYAFYHGARTAGLEIAAVVDERLAAPGRTYRGVPVIRFAQAPDVDAYVVSNTSYVHAEQRRREVSPYTQKPVLNWFAPPQASTPDVESFTASLERGQTIISSA